MFSREQVGEIVSRADNPDNLCEGMNALAGAKAARLRTQLEEYDVLKGELRRCRAWRDIEREAYVLNGDLRNPVEIAEW